MNTPSDVAVAHFPAYVGEAPLSLITRDRREAAQNGEPLPLAEGATRSVGAGTRLREENPSTAIDDYRLCHERDWHRIFHSKEWRRLAGKCQVYIAPDNDHLRTRMTHALEVAQVAEGIAGPLGLNLHLTRAIAIGHDCGHGPAGHASEDALSPFVDGGYDHAVFGADVVLAPLNLCVETLDGIRNHSWRRPAPTTPEAEVVAWADRIAYVCHDFEDAVASGIVKPSDLPDEVAKVVGVDRRQQLNGFITAMLETGREYGIVGMRSPEADALDAFRAFNFSDIYLRPAAKEQADKVIRLISGLVEFYWARPQLMPEEFSQLQPDSPEAKLAAVQFVSGMTDRYALQRAVEDLGWSMESLPKGVAQDSALPNFEALVLPL